MADKQLFKIGEVARMYHLSLGILRHYEKEGLLAPEYTDPETGYRYYSTRQFEVLNTIRYLRMLDLPLAGGTAGCAGLSRQGRHRDSQRKAGTEMLFPV